MAITLIVSVSQAGEDADYTKGYPLALTPGLCKNFVEPSTSPIALARGAVEDASKRVMVCSKRLDCHTLDNRIHGKMSLLSMTQSCSCFAIDDRRPSTCAEVGPGGRERNQFTRL